MNQALVSFESCAVKKGVFVMDLEGVEDSYDMVDGKSFKDRFPSAATFRFDPDVKKNTVLPDCLINVESMMVCSERLKNFIQNKNPDKVEYLPVKIFDLANKEIAASYFIIHPIDPPACIDFSTSEVTWSKQDPQSIRYYKHLEIDENKIAPTRLLFRPKACPGVILLQREFAIEMIEGGFTGMGWREIE